ncbi:MAG: GTPase Era [Bacteroidales bacterium]|nr:GTPase Era [Bacteroidales bacterium]
MLHKAGFVNIIGKPNVGKSTLMNSMVGEKLSIITSKVQTTRHRIMGIVNGEDFQIVYSDTPGIIKPNYKLQVAMMNYVNTALIDADIVLLVTEVDEENDYTEILNNLKKSNIQILVLINKIDLSNQEKVNLLIEKWSKQVDKDNIIPISALKKFNIELVFDKIVEYLPENPPFFSKDQLTDKPERFFVTEIIREKILLYYKKEIPYSVEVVVDTFKEEEEIIRITTFIYVIRETQKAILIGHQGRALKRVGVEARKDLEDFFGKQIYLQLTVKVNKDWRNSDSNLKRFGYE